MNCLPSIILGYGGLFLQRRNIFILVVIIAVLIVGLAVGLTLYEQSLIKVRLYEANDLHNQAMDFDSGLSDAAMYTQSQRSLNDLNNEKGDLTSVSITIFTTQAQKDYTSKAIEINTINTNMFSDYLTLLQDKKEGKLGDEVELAKDINTMHDTRLTLSNERDSIVTEHPGDFGFVPDKQT